ncbi:MAG: hypothetical protein ACF8PN_04920 [Phycisphaerales bacterium]
MATGLAPGELGELEDEDPDTFAALQASAEWNIDRELAAANLELQVLILRAIAGLAGVKGKDLPKPLDIDRPPSWRAARGKAPPSSPMLTGAGLAAWVKGRR